MRTGFVMAFYFILSSEIIEMNKNDFFRSEIISYRLTSE